VAIALEIVAGLVLGYCLASLSESVIHEYVADAPVGMLAFWRRHPRLFRVFINGRYGHKAIHHHQTYRTSHVVQFDSAAHRVHVTNALLRRGRHGRIILAGNFGLSILGEGALLYSLPLMVAAVVLIVLAPATIHLPAMVAFPLPALFSNAVHPFLHMPFAQAQHMAPPLMAAFLRTTYGRAMYRTHFLHHRHGGVSNFNLVLGADWLRGRHRSANADDLRAMRAVGMPIG